MKWLYMYFIDGFPAVVVSIRPYDALHVRRRIYHRIYGSDVVRFLACNYEASTKLDDVTGCIILTLEIKGGTQ